MRKRTIVALLLLAPLISTAPREERDSFPPDASLETYNSTVTEGNVAPLEDSDPLPQNVSKASVSPQPPSPPQITTLPFPSLTLPFLFPRPLSVPFPFPFLPPPPSPPLPPQFPNLDFQVVAFPRPQKNLQEDDWDADAEDEDEDAIAPALVDDVSPGEGRRAPFSNRRKKKKQKKTKKQKKQQQKKPKKQKKQKRPKYPPPAYAQPIIIYQNQDEGVPAEGPQPPMSGSQGTQGAQSSYVGYYMVYVVEVRWTGNNYTQTVVTGRPFPAAIAVPGTTEPGLVNNLSETISPANLVNRPQPTPTCLFQRSTTTEHFGTPELFKPLEITDNPPEEGGQEQVGEEGEESGELDSVEDDYEDDDDSDPKRKRTKKKKRKEGLASSTAAPQ